MTQSLHDELIIIDALQHSRWDREVFEEMRQGGVTAVHVTTAVWEGCRDTLSNIIRFHRLFEEHADIIFQARTVADIRHAKKIGKTAIILGFQNSSPIEDDIGLVQVFYELGVRVMQLTYNNQSLLGSSCYEATDSGIPRFGHEVIREANRLGMIIDLSHCGERTGQEAIDISSRPVAITHAIPKSFHAGIRNKSEGLLRSLAKRGGMLGFSLYPFHIGGKDTPLAKFCEMVARAADVMGVDHIGIGSDHSRKWVDADLDWIRSGRWKKGTDFGEGSATNRSWPEWPAWFRTPAQFPNLTEGLLKQGFNRADVAKIMGENWLRFFENGFGPVTSPREKVAT
jgi:microsomal dipeptidase-like Zn-dependent dipeptidase